MRKRAPWGSWFRGWCPCAIHSRAGVCPHAVKPCWHLWCTTDGCAGSEGKHWVWAVREMQATLEARRESFLPSLLCSLPRVLPIDSYQEKTIWQETLGNSGCSLSGPDRTERIEEWGWGWMIKGKHVAQPCSQNEVILKMDLCKNRNTHTHSRMMAMLSSGE